MADVLTVLCWHNVRPSWCFPFDADAGRVGLDRQLRWLARIANVVPLGPAVEALAIGRPIPHRAVALTFDDGYRDNLEVAIPLLEHLGLSATFFLVPDILSGDVAPWWELLAWGFAKTRVPAIQWAGRTFDTRTPLARTAAFGVISGELKEVSCAQRERDAPTLVEQLDPAGRSHVEDMFLDWDDARSVVGRGFMVGSHSLRHEILSRETPGDQERVLGEAKRQLEAGLGQPVTGLAYPNGRAQDYDGETVEAATSAGYGWAVTTREGVNRSGTSPLEVRRFVVDPDRGVTGLARVPIHISRMGADRFRRSARNTFTRHRSQVIDHPSTSQT